MALCPFARWRPLPENLTEPLIVADQFIVHSAVDAPGRTDLRGYFARADVYAESHFWIYRDGVIDQFMDTNRSADANYRANRRSNGRGALSVETEDEGRPDAEPWTREQVESIVRLGLWCEQVHPELVPRIAPAWNLPGFGFHTLYPDHWTNVAGKTCPGVIRKQQWWSDVWPRLERTMTAEPEPEPEPEEPEMIRRELRRVKGEAAVWLCIDDAWRFLVRDTEHLAILQWRMAANNEDHGVKVLKPKHRYLVHGLKRIK